MFSSAVRWVSSPHSPSHPTPAVQLLHPPIRVALDPQRRGGGGQGHGHQHARHCIGTRRASMHWHTLHPTPKPLRAWGVQRGDCERVRPCIAPPIATERHPFPRRLPRRPLAHTFISFPPSSIHPSTTHTQSAVFTCDSLHGYASSGPSSDFFFRSTSPSFVFFLPSIKRTFPFSRYFDLNLALLMMALRNFFSFMSALSRLLRFW